MLVGIVIDLRPIRNQLMTRVCPEHQLPPDIHILHDRLEINCCCDVFRMQLRREYDSLMYQAINEDMRKEIKRILR